MSSFIIFCIMYLWSQSIPYFQVTGAIWQSLTVLQRHNKCQQNLSNSCRKYFEISSSIFSGKNDYSTVSYIYSG